MRHRVQTSACAIALAFTTASPAVADHDTPRKANALKVEMVRAYAPCTTPNAVHDQVAVINGACAPAVPLSSYGFGPKGQAKAQVQRLGGGIKLRFDVKDVRSAADAPADGVQFTGRIVMRLTDDGCSSAPSCTVETALQVSLPCVGGRCAANVLFPSVLLQSSSGYGAAVEIDRIDVVDDEGGRFATAGILLP